MAKLIYSVITSLDGYIADEAGQFDWSEPDEEVHAFVNDQERPIGTYLYGRRLYDIMDVWQTFGIDDGEPEVIRDYGEIWRAAEKVVYSTTLSEPRTPRTRIESRFDPDAVRRLVDESPTDVGIGGAKLASHAFAASLIDQIQVYLSPVIVGGGTRFLPDGVKLGLELESEKRFTNGVVNLSYAVRR